MTKKPTPAPDKEPVVALPVAKEVKPKGDVVLTSFNNEHADGIECTLTFEDGSTAVGIAPSTGELGVDQESARAMASMA